MKNDKNRDYMVVRSRNKKILGRAKKINISNVDKSGRFTNKKYIYNEDKGFIYRIE